MTWKRLFAVVVLMTCAFALVSGMVAEGALRVRRQRPRLATERLPAGTTVREVSLRASDGARLDAWFLARGHGSRRCVMVLHGVADSRTGAAGLAPLFLESDYAVLVPDSRGHGSSGGEPIAYGLVEKYDTLQWAKWLQNQGCVEMYGLGESLGAAVLIQAAGAGSPFRSIVAECAYRDLPAVAEYRVSKASGLPSVIAMPAAKAVVWGSLLYVRVRYRMDLREASPLESMRRVSTPVLLIHGLGDRDTPPAHSVELAKENKGASLWLVPGAWHTGASAAEPEEFRRRVLDWFSRH